MTISPAPRTRPSKLPVLPITIMAGDLSLTNTGVAIYRAGRIETFSITSPLKGAHRLRELRNKWLKLMDAHQPDVVGFEGYSFGSVSRHHAIGEWGGVAKMTTLEQGVRGYIASPKTVKQFMTDNGNANKAEAHLHLANTYGIRIGQEDEADAACVSILIGAYLHGDAFPPFTKPQSKALKAVTLMV